MISITVELSKITMREIHRDFCRQNAGQETWTLDKYSTADSRFQRCSRDHNGVDGDAAADIASLTQAEQS